MSPHLHPKEWLRAFLFKPAVLCLFLVTYGVSILMAKAEPSLKVDPNDPRFREAARRYRILQEKNGQVDTTRITVDKLTDLVLEWQAFQHDYPDFFPQLINYRLSELRALIMRRKSQRTHPSSSTQASPAVHVSSETASPGEGAWGQWLSFHYLHSRLAEQEAVIRKLQQQLESEKQKGTTRLQINHDLLRKYTEATQEITNLRNKLAMEQAKSSQRIRQLEYDLKQAARTQLDLISRCDSLAKTNQQLLHELNTIKNTLTQERSAHQLCKERLYKREAQINILVDQLKTLQKDLDAKTSEPSNPALKKIIQQMVKNHTTITKLNTIITQQSQTIREQQEQLDILQLANAELRNKIEQAAKRDYRWLIDELRQALQHAEAKQLQLESTMAQLKRQHRVLRASLRSPASTSREDSRALPKYTLLRQELELAVAAIHELHQQNQRQHDEIALLEAENERLQNLLELQKTQTPNASKDPVSLENTAQQIEAKALLNDTQAVSSLYHSSQAGIFLPLYWRIWLAYTRTLSHEPEKQPAIAPGQTAIYCLSNALSTPFHERGAWILRGASLLKDDPYLLDSYLEFAYHLHKTEEKPQIAGKIIAFLRKLKTYPVKLLDKWYNRVAHNHPKP